MKEFLTAVIKCVLWYEAELASSRIVFAGGFLAGTLVSLVIGLIFGFSYTTFVAASVATLAWFFIYTIVLGSVLKIGKRWGDNKPFMDIMRGIRGGKDGENNDRKK